MNIQRFHIHFKENDYVFAKFESVSLSKGKDRCHVVQILGLMATVTMGNLPHYKRFSEVIQTFDAPFTVSNGVIKAGEIVYVIDDNYHITTFVMGGCGALEKQDSSTVSDFINLSTEPELVDENGTVSQANRVIQFSVDNKVIFVGAANQLMANVGLVCSVQDAVNAGTTGAQEMALTLCIIKCCEAMCDPIFGLNPDFIVEAKRQRAELLPFALTFE